MLADGLHDVPAGRTAAIVTHLEMTRPAPLRPAPDLGALRPVRIDRPDPGRYRDLFRRVGADWLWFSRLRMETGALAALLADPEIEIHTIEDAAGQAQALLELDFRQAGTCELAFFGLAAPLIGSGAGRALMNRAIERAWARPIGRLTVHTCTLDHPGALPFYIRSGFVPLRRQVEIAEDPRLTDDLPADAAPQVPLLR